MFTSATGSVTLNTRKGRTATVQPSTNFINSNVDIDNTTALRLQRLRLLGIIGFRAEMLAALAWETSHG